MLQPSLAGNARISVVCTISPEAGAVPETTSTLLFARRVKGVMVRSSVAGFRFSVLRPQAPQSPPSRFSHFGFWLLLYPEIAR